MTISLFSTLHVWDDHIAEVLLRRYTHLTKEKLPADLSKRLADPLMEIPLHYAARSCGQTSSDMLRNLFVMSAQCVFETLHSEQIALLNENEPNAFQPESPHATGHFLRFCGRLEQSKAPVFPLIRLAMHYASLYQLAMESGADGLVKNPLGFDKASFAKMAEEFCRRIHGAIGILPPKGAQIDLLAEAMGFENGFQQLKPCLPHHDKRSRPHGILQRATRSFVDDWLGRLEPQYGPENPEWLGALIRLRDELRVEDHAVSASSWSTIYRGFMPLLLQRPEAMDQNTYSWLKRAVSRYMPQILAHLQPQHDIPRPTRPNCPETAVWDAAVRVAAKFDAAHRAQDIVDSYSEGDDGFELSKELTRRHYWDLQRDDIDTLDEVGDRVEERAAAASWFWVQIFDYPLPFPIGSTIREGVIDGVCDYRAAYYLVKAPDAVDSDNSKTRKLIAFEKARLPA